MVPDLTWEVQGQRSQVLPPPPQESPRGGAETFPRATSRPAGGGAALGIAATAPDAAGAPAAASLAAPPLGEQRFCLSGRSACLYQTATSVPAILPCPSGCRPRPASGCPLFVFVDPFLSLTLVSPQAHLFTPFTFSCPLSLLTKSY